MISNIKRIKIQECEAQIAELEKRLAELEKYGVEPVVDSSAKELTAEEWQHLEQLIQERKQLEKQKTKFFNSLFGKKKIDLQLGDISTKITDYISRENEYLQRTIFELKEKIGQISSKEQLSDFGLTKQQAMDVLKAHNMPIVIEMDSPSEINNINIASTHSFQAKPNSNPDLSVLKDYVLVHRTDYCPNNGRIKTYREVGALNPNARLELDKIGTLTGIHGMTTVHFAVNGPVTKHSAGDWRYKIYAVIIPFPDMPISQLRCCNAVDTYIENGLSLPPSAVIVCPEEEIMKVQTQNPNHTVIGYASELDRTQSVNYVIDLLGYKVQEIGAANWTNGQEQDKYYKQVEKTGLNVDANLHSISLFRRMVDATPRLDVLIDLIKKMITEDINLDLQEIEAQRGYNAIDFTEIDGCLLWSTDPIKFFNEVFRIIDTNLAPYGISVPQNIKQVINSTPESQITNQQETIARQVISSILDQANQIVYNNKQNKQL